MHHNEQLWQEINFCTRHFHLHWTIIFNWLRLMLLNKNCNNKHILIHYTVNNAIWQHSSPNKWTLHLVLIQNALYILNKWALGFGVWHHFSYFFILQFVLMTVTVFFDTLYEYHEMKMSPNLKFARLICQVFICGVGLHQVSTGSTLLLKYHSVGLIWEHINK